MSAPHAMGAGYGAYQVAQQSVGQSVTEFVEAAEKMARRRPVSEKGIDDVIRRLADERREEIWARVKDDLDRMIQAERLQPHPAGATPLAPQYLKEKLDTTHRAGFLLDRALTHYFQRKPPLPFFEWLDSMPELDRVNLLRQEIDRAEADAILKAEGIRGLAARGKLTLMPSEVKMFVKGVEYLNEATRVKYHVEISGGLLVRDGIAFDTGSMRTVFSGLGWAIYVESAETGYFYSASHVKGLFHHSSFLSGAAVRGAGEWRVDGGVPLLITAKSGHYQPSMASFIQVLRSLRDGGVNLFHARARLFRGKGQPVDIPVLDFLVDPKAQAGLSTWG